MKKLKITRLTIGELSTIWGGGAMPRPDTTRNKCRDKDAAATLQVCYSEPTTKCKLGDYVKTK